jgi:hypothetical protein
MLAAGCLILGLAISAAAQPAPQYRVQIRPGPADASGRVSYVDVGLTVPHAEAPAGSPVLSMPLVVANVDSVAKTMTDMVATDGTGALTLEAKDSNADPMPTRTWSPTRAILGDLRVSYRAPVDNTPPKRTGPPFALRTEGGGFSAAGVCLIPAPAAAARLGLSLNWDLSAMGEGASGMSSFGDGDVDVPAAGAADRLTSAFFMAGPICRYPAQPSTGGFSAAWLNKPPLEPAPPFDPQPLMVWAEKLYAWYTDFFRTSADKPYKVFLRFNPVNPGGGVGLMNSFVVTYGRMTTPDSIKGTLAHEMLHTVAPGVGGQWFSEGLAVFYQRLLPWRAGAIGPEAFLADLNDTAARYFTNPLNNTPDDQIAKRFWEDTRIRVLPYDRGAMYMSVVDSKIRKVSAGKRSLDDIVMALLARERQGQQNTVAVWLDMLSREIGAEAKTDLERMLAGALMLPDSSAFGSCFARKTMPLRRFELGFDPKAMNEPRRVIHGLIPGSEAERAGLRNGDAITVPVGLDNIQGDQKQTITLQISRDGETFAVTYLPRGETVETFQWARVPGMADGACRY